MIRGLVLFSLSYERPLSIPWYVDIISKNGVLLLNIAPRADGSIHPQQQAMLRETGKWLRTNGEAVYRSRPWKVHYQGDEPHFYAKGKAFSKTYAQYDADDFRFTRSKDGKTLYVFAMGQPAGDVVIESLLTSELGVESGASLLGQSRALPLGTSEDGHVVLPPTISSTAKPTRSKGRECSKSWGSNRANRRLPP